VTKKKVTKKKALDASALSSTNQLELQIDVPPIVTPLN